MAAGGTFYGIHVLWILSDVDELRFIIFKGRKEKKLAGAVDTMGGKKEDDVLVGQEFYFDMPLDIYY